MARNDKKKNRSQAYAYFVVIGMITALLVLNFLFSNSVLNYAKNTSIEDTIPLLAVSNLGNKNTGAVINLDLKITSGNGNVYIDSSPLSKLDLQYSIKFANKLACRLSSVDCSKLDFFYSIKSYSSLLSGPSGGAATTVLTLSALNHDNLKKGIAMTGTINSGGLIGPVGGVNYKINAASTDNIDHILVPAGQDYNLSEVPKKATVNEVSSIYQAYYYFTGKNITPENASFGNNSEFIKYSTIMSIMAEELCNRSEKEASNLSMLNFSISHNKNSSERKIYDSLMNESEHLNKIGVEAIYAGNFYSGASFCFNSNVDLRTLNTFLKNFSNMKLKNRSSSEISLIRNFNDTLNKANSESLGDIQIKSFVRSRIDEAYVTFDSLLKLINNESGSINASERSTNSTVNITNSIRYVKSYDYSYGVERFYSAKLWYNFLGIDSNSIKVSNSSLAMNCQDLINEISSENAYINTYINSSQFGLNTASDSLIKDYNSGKYDECVVSAVETKSNMNYILTAMYVSKNELSSVASSAFKSADEQIRLAFKRGYWPIAGYAYYEYAKSLYEQKDYLSSLLYSEEAIEFSNFDLYVSSHENKGSFFIGFKTNSLNDTIKIFLIWSTTFAILAVIMIIFLYFNHHRKSKKQSKTIDEKDFRKK